MGAAVKWPETKGDRHPLLAPRLETLRGYYICLSDMLREVSVSKKQHQHTSWLHRASTMLNPFYYQLMHITLKNAELLKHSKLDKNALTCFGLHRNHLQGAKISAWLKITHLVNSICVKDLQGVVSAMAAYCDL